MKCFECRRKISELDKITNKCRCENIYCSFHRLTHECNFNYIELYKKTNNLVKLKSEKMETI